MEKSPETTVLKGFGIWIRETQMSIFVDLIEANGEGMQPQTKDQTQETTIPRNLENTSISMVVDLSRVTSLLLPCVLGELAFEGESKRPGFL